MGMRISVARVLTAVALALAHPGIAAAQSTAPTTMPRAGDILNATTRVGDHFRSAKPCPAGSCSLTNKWDDAVLMMGTTEYRRRFGTTAYRTYAENWANRHSWKLFSDLSKDQFNPNWHNRMTAGSSYLRLLQAGSSGATVADVARNLDNQLALDLTPEREQLIDHVFPGKTVGSFSWKTVDANFMALPVWITMGKHASESRYFDRARDLQNYQVQTMGLQDASTRLWFRDESYKTRQSPNGKKIFWGRGIGWQAGALAIALEELPKTRAEYGTYRTRFVDLMNAVRTRQRPDGFWNMNLADPKHHPAPETSATALITFAIAKGIKLGVLDAATYRPVAAKAWNAMTATAVRNDGYLGFYQAIGKEPVPPSNAGYPSEKQTAECNFCVGAFLLAGSAMHEIATETGVTPRKVYEAESLATSVSSGDSQADVSNRYASGGRANSAKLNAKGDYVQFTAKNVPNGDYSLRVKFRRAANHGIWQLRSDGKNIGGPVDGYDVNPHYAEVDLGLISYAGGPADKRYRFVVTGKNGASSGYLVGIDSIGLASISLFELASGTTIQSFFLQDGEVRLGALVPAAGGAGQVAPVPLPPAAPLLVAGLGLLWASAWRQRRRAAA
jgi:unsaturated rhamnogalacturonyl hydrolase